MTKQSLSSSELALNLNDIFHLQKALRKSQGMSLPLDPEQTVLQHAHYVPENLRNWRLGQDPLMFVLMGIRELMMTTPLLLGLKVIRI